METLNVPKVSYDDNLAVLIVETLGTFKVSPAEILRVILIPQSLQIFLDLSRKCHFCLKVFKGV